MNHTTGIRYCFFVFAVVITLPCISIDAKAYWSDDPLSNLLIGGGTGSQAVPHSVPAPDGGCWVSWYDGGAGYDVRLQRLDVYGQELWGPNGILIGDLNYSSVQDFSLDSDISDNVIVTYLSNASGSDQVHVNLAAPDGTLPWGAEIQLTSGSAYVVKPEAAALIDGSYAVAWGADDATVIQRLNSDGDPLWDEGITFTEPGGGTFLVADIEASEDGGVIVLLVQYIEFWGPKHLYVQKLSVDGDPLWGDSPFAIFDSGSLQFGNFPDFETDGSGGAVFSWYDTYGAILQCYVQHVDSDGTELLAHNGLAVSTSTSRQRVTPVAKYNASGNIFAFWVEQSLNQSLSGIYGQRISSGGTREWTDNGVEIEPVDSSEEQQVEAIIAGDGAIVAYMQEAGLVIYHLLAARVDAAGNLVWTPDSIDVSTAESNKAYLCASQSTADSALLFWDDMRSDDGDIYGQNVNLDGTLGVDIPSQTPTPTTGPTDTPSATFTANPTPTSTPMVTSTQTPVATSTPAATSTNSPTPEPTEIPSETPTQIPTDTPPDTPTSAPTDVPSETPTPTQSVPPLGVRIEVPSMVHPGNEFHVTGFLDNPDAPMSAVPTFFLLEIQGQFWFWPAWSYFDPSDAETISFSLEDVPTGTKVIEVLPSFSWPDTGDLSMGALRFWGAMLSESRDSILGGFAMEEWGFGAN